MELEELRKNNQIYFRRFKKEKRYRRRLQEQLEHETKRRVQMEEALRVTSADTLKRITESLAKEMESQQIKRARLDPEEDGSGSSTKGDKDMDDDNKSTDNDDKRSTSVGGVDHDELDRQSSPASVSSSSKQFNATVSATDAASTTPSGGGGGSTSRGECNNKALVDFITIQIDNWMDW